MTDNNQLTCNTEDAGDNLIPTPKKAVKKTCVRCKEKPSIILFRTDPMCWDCYHEMIIKKFKLNVTRFRDNKKDVERLMLAVSGGVSSRVMMDLVSHFIGGNGSKGTKAKLFFKVCVVHINISCLDQVSGRATEQDHLDHAQRQANLVRSLEEAAQQYEFPFYNIPLENIYGCDESNKKERQQMLIDSFTQFTSSTSKEDILEHFRNQLLFETAHSLGFNKILFGTSSNRLATRLLSSTSKGRGYNVPNETNMVDQHKDIRFIQPMRDFLLKEIHIYHRKMSFIDYTNHNVLLFNNNSKGSINALCEKFINHLQDISNQTIHTLLRSVDKLVSPIDENSVSCSICCANLSEQEIKQLEQYSLALKSSSSSSTTTSTSSCKSSCNNCSASSSCCSTNNNNNNNNNNNSIQLTNNIHKPTLCYSCNQLLRDVKQPPVLTVVPSDSTTTPTPPTLPIYVQKNSTVLLKSYQLRNEIKDFLLDDDE
ncbi:cytosolic thiouridylase subunit 2 [Cavenderia fasciculata]|uniref:Cytoplasmic tRNA 2-thiolation protein 2 n=1 Tax=Cavenderia fasciculata TaxID=261658 RepID=F4Q486_CACFS|nr:cytosolic thiouridylase subunit 2 [Cavenderia fasciculata]EGG17788.1 cytosolic thiouridylase subunit 2 [Cavenderia fasciculata]|eukprot:XP_004356272.1 cytosolic thiouridylase subunit 2 [Cavenderia fasciculata]